MATCAESAKHTVVDTITEAVDLQVVSPIGKIRLDLSHSDSEKTTSRIHGCNMQTDANGEPIRFHNDKRCEVHCFASEMKGLNRGLELQRLAICLARLGDDVERGKMYARMISEHLCANFKSDADAIEDVEK